MNEWPSARLIDGVNRDSMNEISSAGLAAYAISFAYKYLYN